jgi:hypothetical protein
MLASFQTFPPTKADEQTNAIELPSMRVWDGKSIAATD